MKRWAKNLTQPQIGAQKNCDPPLLIDIVFISLYFASSLLFVVYVYAIGELSN